jgi:chromate transporter
VHYRILGATLAGLAFVLPSFLMVLGIGYAYVMYGGLSWMQSIFYGVGAAVIGIIAVSSYKLTSKSIGKDKLLIAIAGVLAIVTFLFEKEILWLIILSGILVWFAKSPPSFIKTSSLIAGPLVLVPLADIFSNTRLTQLAWFFTKAGAFVFGSGLAIVPFLYGGVVKEYQWLNEQQFLDAVAVAMITPGPVVITVGFIGYLVAGFPGACVAALATFLPCYLFTVIPAPYFKKYGKNPRIKAFVDGITAAAIGAIIGAVLVLAKRSLVDLPTWLMALATLAVLLKFKRVKEPWVIAAAALIGLIFKSFFIS